MHRSSASKACWLLRGWLGNKQSLAQISEGWWPSPLIGVQLLPGTEITCKQVSVGKRELEQGLEQRLRIQN